MKDVIGFGAINLDLIYKIKDESAYGGQLSERAISPKKCVQLEKILAQNAELKLKSGGGSAANTVYALAKMGFKTGYIGKVGKDEEGKFLLKNLKPVDTSQVRFGEKSGICLVLVCTRYAPEHTGVDGKPRKDILRGKERIIHILPNSNNTLRYEEIDLNYTRKTKFLHLTSFTGDSPFEAQKKLIREMFGDAHRLAGITCRLSFDPGRCYAEKGLKALLPIIEKSYIMFPSEEEVKLLTGKNYKQGAKVLLDCGTKIVVCTRGAKGSYIFTQKEEYEIPSNQGIKVADPTGAGDVYAAGFLAGLLLNLPIKKCGFLATRLAEISITGYGREKYPNRNSFKLIVDSL